MKWPQLRVSPTGDLVGLLQRHIDAPSALGQPVGKQRRIRPGVAEDSYAQRMVSSLHRSASVRIITAGGGRR